MCFLFCVVFEYGERVFQNKVLAMPNVVSLASEPFLRKRAFCVVIRKWWASVASLGCVRRCLFVGCSGNGVDATEGVHSKSSRCGAFGVPSSHSKRSTYAALDIYFEHMSFLPK